MAVDESTVTGVTLDVDDRWPAATSWVRLSDDGLTAWSSTKDHRIGRRYDR
ncbi:hypothetical protein [Haloarchaeobius sp. DYHT-AS-18]|uniref:hypothetical protein n=1 Tax=Haloarchaeobius sp. DYHT-AS-18 TaxID=3446117 RepID=UPI003EBCEC5C